MWQRYWVHGWGVTAGVQPPIAYFGAVLVATCLSRFLPGVTSNVISNLHN